MRLSPHFTLEELVFSQTAERLGIDNSPTAEVIANLARLCEEVLEPTRQMIGAPIWVTSGYRSAALNRAVGGAQFSAHMEGRAADIVAPAFGTPYELAERMAVARIEFDKLILEFGRWVHVQIPAQGRARRLLLTARKDGRGTAYVPGLAKEVA